MKREDIVDAVVFKVNRYGDEGNATWSSKELENAMVAAYNRAIEDAIELYGPYPRYDKPGLEELKIKE
jgi:hypothetical protein